MRTCVSEAFENKRRTGSRTLQSLPTEADYLRQLSYPMVALRLCDEAMHVLLRVQGGNGLREGGSFERRYRDFQAMPLHINAHPDRVAELIGKFLLGLTNDASFQ